MTGYSNQKRKLPGRFFWRLCGQTAGAVGVFFLVLSLFQNPAPESQYWKQAVQQCFTTDADLAPVMQLFYTNETNKQEEQLSQSDFLSDPDVMQVGAAPVAYEPMVVPVSGKVVQDYGQETAEASAAQPGILIATAPAEEVLAAYAGTVTGIETNDAQDITITISHANGFITTYGGCTACYVQLNEPVKKGQTIGQTDAAHQEEGNFYFSATYLGTAINPLELLQYHDDAQS